jgi:pantetheine-phosphate adenylyltransferase
MRTALYPGTFDPITLGHVDIVHRGLEIFESIEISVAKNMKKTPSFSDDERVQMISETFANEPRIRVTQFEGLLVDYARKQNITTVLRGLRAMSDFEYEFQRLNESSTNRRCRLPVPHDQ